MAATCPVQPVYHPQQSKFPSIVQVGNKIPVYMEQSATVRYFTILGQYYTSYTMPQGHTYLSVPDTQGAYILFMETSSGETQTQTMIVE